MRIIQTLWLDPNEDPIAQSCGWLSPEYDWISWSLCMQQLRQFNSDVELYANDSAAAFLNDDLRLYYSQVHILPKHANLSKFTWALAKILTYSIQETPFLHVDGDVFLQRPFDTALLQAEIIAQNIEHDSTEYLNNYDLLCSTNNNSLDFLYLSDLSSVKAYNAGIIGGSDINFFKAFSDLAMHFVEKTSDGAANVLSSTSYCMLFEQWMFGLMVNYQNKQVSVLYPEGTLNSSYVGYDNFEHFYKSGYFHFMGQFKHNRHNLKMMAAKLRKDNPAQYYHILQLCKSKGVILDFAIYQLPELDPLLHSSEYFIQLFEAFALADTHEDMPNWLYYYAKDYVIFAQLEEFFLLNTEQLLSKSFKVTCDFKLTEEHDPLISQKIHLYDTFNLSLTTIDLDNLEMIILDCFSNGTITLAQVLELVGKYFPEQDFEKNSHILLEQIMTKVRRFIYWGVLTML